MRSASDPSFDGREGSRSDVIQSTNDGFPRATARNLTIGETHTRAVDVSCGGEGKCVKQVEVDQKPLNVRFLAKGALVQATPTAARCASSRSITRKSYGSTRDGVPSGPRPRICAGCFAPATTFS